MRRRRVSTLAQATLKRPPVKVVEDTFTDSDGTIISVHTPDLAWPTIHWEYTGKEPVINTNRAAAGIAGQASGAVIESWYFNGRITCSLRSGATITANSKKAVVFRYTDDANYWYAEIANTGGNNLRLVEVVGGVETERGSTTQTYGISNANAVTVILAGALIHVYFDSKVITYASAASGLTATKHGFRLFADGGTVADWEMCDSFRVYA